MSHHPDDMTMRSQAEAREIVAASNSDVHAYIRRGIKERWLSRVVRYLNSLERQPGTRELARRALQRLGFPTASARAATGRYRRATVLRVGIVPVVSARCGHATQHGARWGNRGSRP